MLSKPFAETNKPVLPHAAVIIKNSNHIAAGNISVSEYPTAFFFNFLTLIFITVPPPPYTHIRSCGYAPTDIFN